MSFTMIIAVGILSAVLGIVIGFLVARVKSAGAEAAANQAGVELEKQVAVLRSQLEAETRKVAEVRADDDRRLAEIKAESAKMLESTKQELEHRPFPGRSPDRQRRHHLQA